MIPLDPPALPTSLAAASVGYRQFADRLGVPYGTVKRWATEGLPIRRSIHHRSNQIPLTEGLAWVESHRGKSVSFNRSSTIYFAQRQTDGAVKIGWTSDVERRLRELRKENRVAVVLLAAFPGDKPDEGRMHLRFAADRIDGEWFRASPSLMSLVNREPGS